MVSNAAKPSATFLHAVQLILPSLDFALGQKKKSQNTEKECKSNADWMERRSKHVNRMKQAGELSSDIFMSPSGALLNN